MDLLSGYSDNINYGNGYTPLANNAIANNNIAFNNNQAATKQAGMYDPFAQSGGFGAQTDYYSGLGAAYGRETGGFNGGDMPIYGGGSSIQRGPDLPDLSVDPWATPQPKGAGGDQMSKMPGWEKYFSGLAENYHPNPTGASEVTGYDYNDPKSYAPKGGWGNAPTAPNMQQLLGYTPDASLRNDLAKQMYGAGGSVQGAGGSSMPIYGGGASMMASGGDPSWLGAGQPGSDYNPFGKINSGQVGQYDAFGGYKQPTGQPYGPAYFDNTFGAANSQPQVYNPTYGGTYPGAMSSDFMNDPKRLDAIKSLQDILGTTVAPAYDPHTADTWTSRS